MTTEDEFRPYQIRKDILSIFGGCVMYGDCHFTSSKQEESDRGIGYPGISHIEALAS